LAGKGTRYYDSLLGKGVENAQKQKLREGFEFSSKSWLADKIVTKFNNEMAIWEKEHGVTRLKPGEILVMFQGKEVVIPLLKSEWLKRLASWGHWAEMRPELEMEILEVLKKIDADASLTSVRHLFNQRGFLPPRSDGFKWKYFKFPANLGRPQSYHTSKVNLPEDLMIPISIMKEMVEYLTSAEKLSPGKATAIVELLALERERFCPPRIQVKPGQIVWVGMDAAEPISFYTKTSHRKQVPLLLTLYTPQEWQETSSITTLEKLYQYVLPRLERVCFEAYHKGAVLCEAELHLMFFLGPCSISKLARRYMEHTGIILPLAGTIKDYGRATTHKRIIIRKHLEGWLNKEIARFTHHDEESVDKYIEVFKSVTILYVYGLPQKLMARILNKYPGVINEHIDIIESFLGERSVIVGYLKKQGINVP